MALKLKVNPKTPIWNWSIESTTVPMSKSRTVNLQQWPIRITSVGPLRICVQRRRSQWHHQSLPLVHWAGSTLVEAHYDPFLISTSLLESISTWALVNRMIWPWLVMNHWIRAGWTRIGVEVKPWQQLKRGREGFKFADSRRRNPLEVAANHDFLIDDSNICISL